MRAAAAVWLLMPFAWAQQPTNEDWRKVLERLERLEQQNRELLGEIRALRTEISTAQSPPATREAPAAGVVTTATGGTLAERVEVLEQRTADHEQSKLETEHRLPVQLSGMMLFNAFVNGKNAAGVGAPLVAGLSPDVSPTSGGTFRQSIIGLKFQGPKLFGNSEVTGSVSFDLFAGSGVPLNQALRLRVATLDWSFPNTTISVAHDKPIIAPREPVSLALVGVSPLTAAGNLWFWQPQVRVEQRVALGEFSGLRLQAGVIQTNEAAATVPADVSPSLAATRPGFESRLEWWKSWGANDGRRLELAPGFHVSETHVNGVTVPSRIYSMDWLIRPWSRVDLTGSWFYGGNSRILGGLSPGLVFNNGTRAVLGNAEWAQLAVRLTQRATLHFYGGEASNHASDVRTAGSLLSNRVFAGNLIYKFGTNVLAGVEVYQARTEYLRSGTRLVNHYDLSIAYLF